VLYREKKTGSIGLAPAQGVFERSDLVIQVIVPVKENTLFRTGASLRLNRAAISSFR
jgi:hypothetical protein